MKKNEIQIILTKWLMFFMYSLLTKFQWIQPDVAKIFNLNMYIKDGSFNEISLIIISFFYAIGYILYLLYLLLDFFKKSNIEYINFAKKIILIYALLSLFAYACSIIFYGLTWNKNYLILIPSYEDKFIFNTYIVFGFLLSILFAYIKNSSTNKGNLKKSVLLSFFMLTVILTSLMNLNVSIVNQINKEIAITQGQDSYENKENMYIHYPVIEKNTNILSSDIIDIIYYVNFKKDITEKYIFDIMENYYKNYIKKSDFIATHFENLYKDSRVYKNELLIKKYKDNDLVLIEYYKKEGLDKTLEKVKSENYQSIISMLLIQKKYIK